MAAPSAPTPPQYLHRPLFWVARLESAQEAGDLEQAANDQVHLRQLGLRVEPLAQWQKGELRDED